MPITVTIYADNADGARPWVCLSSDLPDKALVRLTRDDGHAPTRLGRNNVVLRVRAATTTDEVAAGDLVAPQWALDVLGVAGHGGARGAGVAVELLPPSVLQQLPPLTEVHVTYVAHQSHRHWDEVATSTAFDAPGSWSSVWPGGVSKTVLSRMLPVMLRSRQVVVDRSVAVLDVLDVSMVSQSHACCSTVRRGRRRLIVLCPRVIRADVPRRISTHGRWRWNRRTRVHRGVIESRGQ